jgi:hypothetical protein
VVIIGSSDDVLKTQHFTSNALKMVENLIDYIPKDAKVIEPFVGDGDLILDEFNYVEVYDIDPIYVEGDSLRDTLLYPPDYTGKYVITNPPYLAKNKTKDKTIFNLYDVDDWYKAAIKTMLDCEGGLLVIPFNFFTDENSKKLRISFFKRFNISYMNVFNFPIFENTTYTTCAFVFTRKKKESYENECVKTFLYDDKKEVDLLYEYEYGYRLGGADLNIILKEENLFTRLLKDQVSTTNIKIHCIDSRYKLIRAEVDEPYYGILTDRAFLTLKPLDDNFLSDINEDEFCDLFNKEINFLRKKYHNLIFTTYRDFGRKRVSFDFVYKLSTLLVKKLKEARK